MLDCGPTCLRMITNYHGRNYTIQTLRSMCNTNTSGATLLDISEAAEKLGLRSIGFRLDEEHLKAAELPCVLHWRQNHFVILYKVTKKRYYLADPALGLLSLTGEDLRKSWLATDDDEAGNALILQPTPAFYQATGEKNRKLNWSFILRYLFAYRNLLIQLMLSLAIGTLIQIAAPFLTQTIVDVGINTQNLDFINIILVAQLMLFAGSTSVDFIRSWVLLHISTRVNVAILSDFLNKLMKLPMGFFDTKTTGDILQRINDEKRLETFLTGSTLSMVFSMFNFAVFSVIILFYNKTIFLVFAIATILYTGWILVFLKQRRKLDYKQFTNYTLNQDNLMEIVNGMQEIKLNNAEFQKKWKWEHIQARLFRFNIKSLALNQYQQAGAMFVNQGKNILITYLCAKAVIEGQLTLGSMMAIQYIIGQLNSPVEQFIGFIKSYQDAKISIERLNEIHHLEDEEQRDMKFDSKFQNGGGITISNLTFRYPGAGNRPVLEDINLHMPEGKTTAIVGMSGSGKTTIIKLLMRFYEPEAGSINVGSLKLRDLKYKLWRKECSAVMQDGYIFSDTILNNITIGCESPADENLEKAIRIANIQDVIEAMPYGIHSKIGSGGNGISQGQKQRILIARAIYKNPSHIFFDEATNALDANNERMIVNNLNEFLTGKTVVVVAHRLSTVKDADNIVVLNKGKIVEQGTHIQLTALKGEYYNLIKNQLELGI